MEARQYEGALTHVVKRKSELLQCFMKDLTGVLLRLYIYDQVNKVLIIDGNPDGAADDVHAPAGGVSRSIPLPPLNLSCTIKEESVLCALDSKYRCRV